MNDTTNLFSYKERLADAKNKMDALPRGARARCARDFGVSASRVGRVLNGHVGDINGLWAILKWLKSEIKPGTQIIYVPNHEMEMYRRSGIINFNSGGSQPGFVACKSMKDDAVFCRYWLITHTKEVLKYDLRTKANSELTPIRNLVVRNTVPQEIVDELMVELGYVA